MKSRVMPAYRTSVRKYFSTSFSAFFTAAVLTVIPAGMILAGCSSVSMQGGSREEAVEAAEYAGASENGATEETPESSVNAGTTEIGESAKTADPVSNEEAAAADPNSASYGTAAAADPNPVSHGTAAAELPEDGASVETQPQEAPQEVLLVYGDERADLYLSLLEGKRAAVFSNQTGIVGNRIRDTLKDEEDEEESASDGAAEETPGGEISAEDEGLVLFGEHADGTPVEYGEHILDALVRQGVDVRVAFSPEHGFRGTEDAGAQVGDYIDEKTGVPVVSLYGSGSMYPSAADMDRFDTLVIDIQDVGLRYYTYYISMYYLMDACAAAGKEVVILDRPNPNGYYVDGPTLREDFSSGIGILPIPVVHGMTLGELAQMINGEGWLSAGKDACSLTVVPCDNYTHSMQTALVARPSPNLKDMRAIYLYASTCFFENTACSVGRGTMHPFEIYGSPHLEGAEGYEFTFIPGSMEGAHSPPYEGQVCYGKDLRDIPFSQIREDQINLNYVIDAYSAMQEQDPGISFFGRPDGYGHYWMDYLCGTDQVRRMIEDGSSAEEIRAWWQEDVKAFKEQRRPYLLYAE